MQLDQGVVQAISTHFQRLLPGLNEYQNYVTELEVVLESHRENDKKLPPPDSMILAENEKLRMKVHHLKKALKLAMCCFKLSRSKIKKKCKKHYHWDMLKGERPVSP